MSVTSFASKPKDIYEYLTTLVKQATLEYLAEEHIDFDVQQLPIDIRFSAQASFGDYSMPAMSWAAKNKLGRPPLQIAEALATRLRGMDLPGTQEITVTKPGYLNFRLNRVAMGRDIIERVIEEGADFGLSDIGVGTKVVVEHTAVNIQTPRTVSRPLGR